MLLLSLQEKAVSIRSEELQVHSLLGIRMNILLFGEMEQN